LALECLDPETGRLVHLPTPGAVIEQDAFILDMIRNAWRVWSVSSKPDRRKKLTQEDRDFMTWLLPENYSGGKGEKEWKWREAVKRG